jgi:hypothetical protein
MVLLNMPMELLQILIQDLQLLPKKDKLTLLKENAKELCDKEAAASKKAPWNQPGWHGPRPPPRKWDNKCKAENPRARETCAGAKGKVLNYDAKKIVGVYTSKTNAGQDLKMELQTKFDNPPKEFDRWCIHTGCVTEIYAIVTNLVTNAKKYKTWHQDCDNHFKLSSNAF